PSASANTLAKAANLRKLRARCRICTPWILRAVTLVTLHELPARPPRIFPWYCATELAADIGESRGHATRGLQFGGVRPRCRHPGRCLRLAPVSRSGPERRL